MYDKLKLLICAVGICASYSVYGYLQEDITKSRYGLDRQRFNFTTSMILIQCVINAIIALVAGVLRPDEAADKTPLHLFAFCALTYIVAMFSSNYSLRFVSYPTQVLGKSCKPIGVLFTSVVFFRRGYSLRKWILVSVIVMGVAAFVWKEPVSEEASKPTTWGWGEVLLFLSLVMDGLTGSQQDGMRTAHGTGSFRMMLHMNLWSTLYLAIHMVYSGELLTFLHFVRLFPATLYKICLFGVCSAIGQLFIFTTVIHFGPLQCSIITTTRKFFNMLLSIFIFNHALLPRQWLATVVIFVALFLDNLWKEKKSSAVGKSSSSSNDNMEASKMNNGRMKSS